jgi:hypothetical protein
LSKSTIKGDSCENENMFCVGGGVTIVSTNSGEIVDTGGVTTFSGDSGEKFGTGGVGSRGNGVSTGGLLIGIAVSSATAVIGDSCRLIDLISCTS